MKTLFCRSCNSLLSVDAFPKRVRDGLRRYSRCNSCEAKSQKLVRDDKSESINKRRRENYPKHKAKMRDSFLKRKYGLTNNEWEIIFKRQGECCFICKTTDPKGRGWQSDHNHSTGKFRAILCHHCNSLLGHANEDVQILERAVFYLKLFNGDL